VPAAPISRFQTPESRPYKPLGRIFSALLATMGEPDIKKEMGSPGGGTARDGGFRNRQRLAMASAKYSCSRLAVPPPKQLSCWKLIRRRKH
jgi:hypothetical protein